MKMTEKIFPSSYFSSLLGFSSHEFLWIWCYLEIALWEALNMSCADLDINCNAFWSKLDLFSALHVPCVNLVINLMAFWIWWKVLFCSVYVWSRPQYQWYCLLKENRVHFCWYISCVDLVINGKAFWSKLEPFSVLHMLLADLTINSSDLRCR